MEFSSGLPAAEAPPDRDQPGLRATTDRAPDDDGCDPAAGVNAVRSVCKSSRKSLIVGYRAATQASDAETLKAAVPALAKAMKDQLAALLK